MKSLKKIVIINAVLISSIGISAFIRSGPEQNKTIKNAVEGKGFAVLELFTSEGCNSCPPAEEILAKINRESNGKPIYILNYHVDYFDYLGWKDAFGSPENTKRQRKYSSWLNAQVYTPQLIINGSKEFIGSDDKLIRKQIVAELITNHPAKLSIYLERGGNVIKVNYYAQGIGANDDLQLALVQKSGSSNVLRGENAGLRFAHVQIVRSMLTISLKDATPGTKDIYIPLENPSEQWEVIGIIQNRKTGLISGADSKSVLK